MKYQDYYRILGVERNATPDEIKRAFRRLARKYHPDVSKETQAEAHMKEVNEAYTVLSDPEKRAAYDRLGGAHHAGDDFRPPPDWGRDFRFSTHGFSPHEAEDFSDFFSQLFGGPDGFSRQGGARRGKELSMRDEDILIGSLLEDSCMTLEQLAAARTVDTEWLRRHIEEGLFPHAESVSGVWRFSSAGLARARRMRQLERDFDAVPELAALVADLLEEMDAMRARLGRY